VDKSIAFPEDFGLGVRFFGVSGGSAWNEDGKGPSIWDTLCTLPAGLQRRDRATSPLTLPSLQRRCPLMKELWPEGLPFIDSWSAILPNGTGAVNQAGLDFYDRLWMKSWSRRSNHTCACSTTISTDLQV